MFCPKCGNKIEDNSEFCSSCGASVNASEPAPQKPKVKLNPAVAVALVLAVVSFIFGFVLVTCNFATSMGIGYIDIVAALPALVSLSIGVYKFCDESCNKHNKTFALICIAISAFVLVYTLLGFIVFIAKFAR